jgi:hypothetical protein
MMPDFPSGSPACATCVAASCARTTLSRSAAIPERDIELIAI